MLIDEISAFHSSKQSHKHKGDYVVLIHHYLYTTTCSIALYGDTYMKKQMDKYTDRSVDGWAFSQI